MKLSSADRLEVRLEFEIDAPRVVGRLARLQHRVLFEYDPTFLLSGLELSPLHLPLRPGIHEDGKRTFDGLFGVFHDSLPDGWGRLLLDRELRRRALDPAQAGALDRLAYVGEAGMGALTYRPAHDALPPPDAIDLHRLASESRQVLEGEPTDLLPQLFRMGGSSGGARPKVFVQLSSTAKELVAGDNVLRPGFEPYIVKFPSAVDPKDVGAMEHAYAQMARAAGIEMEPTRLLAAKGRHRGFFATRRFDRRGAERRHVHSASGLLHADHRVPSADYDTLLRATRMLTRDEREVARMLRRAAFNVFAHNRDDHTKNFAFIMSRNGEWRLAPAYDLTFSSGPNGEHATMVAGEGRAPTKAHLGELARRHSVARAALESMLDEVQTAIAEWPRFAAEAGVSKASTKRVSERLRVR